MREDYLSTTISPRQSTSCYAVGMRSHASLMRAWAAPRIRRPSAPCAAPRPAGKLGCSAGQIAADSVFAILYTVIQNARLNDVDPQA